MTTRNVKDLPQVCLDRLIKQSLKAGFASNCQVLNFNTEISIGKSIVFFAFLNVDITRREMVETMC